MAVAAATVEATASIASEQRQECLAVGVWSSGWCVVASAQEGVLEKKVNLK